MDTDDTQLTRDWIETFFIDVAIIWWGAATYYISFGACLRYLIKYRPHSPLTRRHRNFILVFLGCSFVATTVFIIVSYGDDAELLRCLAESKFSSDDCLEGSGPVSRTDDIYRTMYVASEIVIYFCADGMLLYRAIVIWKWKIWLLILGPMFWLAQTGVQIYRFLPFTTYSTTYGHVSWTLAVAYDVTMSSLIIGKLWYFRRKAESAGGEGNLYRSLMIMFLEACVLTSSTRIVNLVTDWNANWWNPDWWDEDLSALGSAIAPLLAILRLAVQRSPPRQEVHIMSPVHFSSRKRDNSKASVSEA